MVTAYKQPCSDTYWSAMQLTTFISFHSTKEMELGFCSMFCFKLWCNPLSLLCNHWCDWSVSFYICWCRLRDVWDDRKVARLSCINRSVWVRTRPAYKYTEKGELLTTVISVSCWKVCIFTFGDYQDLTHVIHRARLAKLTHLGWSVAADHKKQLTISDKYYVNSLRSFVTRCLFIFDREHHEVIQRPAIYSCCFQMEFESQTVAINIKTNK